MKLTYCDEWSMVRKKPWNIIDSTQAQQNHINKIPYTVLIQENDQIENIIEVTNSNISVNFMNESRSSYLCYVFDVKCDDSIFLSMAYHYNYDESGNDIVVGTTFNFNENGYLFMEKRDYKTGAVEERDLQSDVTPNWDKFPEFGEYEHLLRSER